MCNDTLQPTDMQREQLTVAKQENTIAVNMSDSNLAVDVQENKLMELNREILATLLKDRATGKNIIWATEDYSELGAGYQASSEITLEAITGEHGRIIQPRAVKSKEQQGSRTRNMAEVFTPTWICNKMNNLVDAAWFGREQTFNVEQDNDWTALEGKVDFPEKAKNAPKGWENYLRMVRLEITCGEGPYLVSRYDTVTGEALPLERRVGLLDRKLRVLNEHIRMFKDVEKSRQKWKKWALLALRSVYGFEWQGDNVLLARENLLYTVMDYYEARFDEAMPSQWLTDFAETISWNIWQMDGLKCVVPNSCHEYKRLRKPTEPSLFDNKAFSATALKRSVSICDVEESELQKCQGCLKDDVELHNGVYCKIKDWRTQKVYKFKDLLSGQGSEGVMGKDFKFDVVIGNPPYQETAENTSDKPIYDKFMTASYNLADRVMLITPARFLFNAGKTPKEWNKKMLEDEYLRVLYYNPDPRGVFRTTEIKGGVAITYRDKTNKVGAIGVFTKYQELQGIISKIRKYVKQENFVNIMILQNRFNLDALYKDYPEYRSLISSGGRERRIVSSSFDKLDVFKSNQTSQRDIKILGVVNANNRQYKWINSKYVEDNGNLSKWKVIVPKTNGNGNLGEVLTKPQLLEPNVGYTQSFIGIGSFETEPEAASVLKYLKSKFLRVLLGVLKITQDNPPEKWSYIPLQDFTPSSDIDWSKSISEIDQQLYKKYGLSDEEISFIETNVKPMD